MTLDEILYELSSLDEGDLVVVVSVVTSSDGVPTEVRTMATDMTGPYLLAAAAALAAVAGAQAMVDDSVSSSEAVVNAQIADRQRFRLAVNLAVDALLDAPS